ncbi:hypothetical protein JCM3765_004691 [Sporobolomyces pararoseus]
MRPPFKNGGGKKGMRQVTGKHQKKIILRPAPAPNTTSSSSKGKEREIEPEGLDYMEEEGDEEEEDEYDGVEHYGYRESLQQDSLPLAGFRITVSGCSGQKQDLLKLAEEYGAERHTGLQENTTHLITDQMSGAKYKTALERRMSIMTPEWLPAVREAWTSGEKVDFDQIEIIYRLKPLEGVIFTMTQFAAGDYKEDLKNLMMDAGGEYSTRLDSNVTHLIVASLNSPRSNKPSDKIVHGLRNRQHLHPEFEMMWEGWAREAIKFGGRREERDQIWIYQPGKGEPVEDLSWTVDQPPQRHHLASTHHPPPRASTSTALLLEPTRKLSQTSRDLAGGGGGGAGAGRKFTGYDNSITESIEEQTRRAATATSNHDLMNGKILKKRRRTNVAPDASQGNPEQLFDVFGEIVVANNINTNNPQYQPVQEQEEFDLPHPDEIGGGGGGDLELPVPPPGYEDSDMVYEMREGEVGLQRTKKSKSAIKAITSKRTISQVETAPKSIRPPTTTTTESRDDSGFLENTEEANKEEEQAPVSSNGSSQANPTIFEGLTLAVMEIKAKPSKSIASHIERCGGKAIVNASEEDLNKVDWIVVDFVEPPERFMNSSDPRVVSVCWIEYCLWADKVVPITDRILDRPIPFKCPVKGAEKFLVHFSGWDQQQTPDMHHNRRYLRAVGVQISMNFSRSCTHLILKELEDYPELSPSQILESNTNNNRKLEKAREWGKGIISMRELRKQISELAATRDKEEKGTGAGEGGGEGEESIRGPLEDCVVYFSTKSTFDRQSLANIVKDLGGTAARQYSDSITHFIHGSEDATTTITTTSSYKDLKLAKSNSNCQIVHPRWIQECGRTGSRISETDFPLTFDSKKGGQLFNAGMRSLTPLSTSTTTLERVVSPPSPPLVSNRPSLSSREETNKAIPTTTKKKKKDQLEFEKGDDDQEVVDNESRSLPNPPRRRRSDSTRTEIEEEEDQEEEVERQGLIEAGTSVILSTAVGSSSITGAGAGAGAGARGGGATGQSLLLSSSEGGLSCIPLRQTDEDSMLKEKRKKDEDLKRKTDALKFAMVGNGTEGGVGIGIGKNGRNRTNIFGKKQQSIPQLATTTTTSPSKKLNSPTRTTSLPTLLPSSSPSHNHQQQQPGGGLSALHPPPSSSIQYTQSQALTNRETEEIRVVFDEPAAFQARQNAIKRQKQVQEQEEEEKRKKKLLEENESQEGRRRVTRSAKKGMY